MAPVKTADSAKRRMV